jgi:hypothetical protein
MLKLGPMFGKMLSGETVIREFSTVGLNDNIREKVLLKTGSQVLDVSGSQWLLGLDPRVLGVWLERKEDRDRMQANTKYEMYFMEAESTLATLELERSTSISEDNGTLFLLRVTNCHIRHIHSLKARLLYWKFYKKPGVTFDRLKAVAAAYTYPRRVRIISFKQEGGGHDRHEGGYDYIFPMDLLGDIRSAGRYLLGMRHSNQVLTRIMDEKKIVVSEVPASYKPFIYKLGRNHSAAPPPLDQLPFGVIATREFGFYIPEWAESYKEIHIRKTLNLGSHMLLFGEWTSDVVLQPPTPRLHHIHFLHFLHQKEEGMSYPLV